MLKRTLFTASENATDLLLAGGFLLSLWVFSLRLPEGVVFHLLDNAAEQLDAGALMGSAGVLVLINTARAIPLYTGWFLLGEGLATRFPKARFLTWVLPLAAIPASYALLARLSGTLVLHFGMPALLGVFSVVVLRLLTRDIPGWLNRSLALALLLFSFQWLDITPSLTRYGFGRGELSLVVKEVSTLIGGGADKVLDGMGFLGFFGAFAGGLATTELLVSLGKRLKQLQLLREQERQIAALREEALQARSLLEMGQLVHDLKRPLTTIIGLTDVLAATPRKGDEQACLDRMTRASSTMNTMISEILSEEVRRRLPVGDVLAYTLSQLGALPWRDRVRVSNAFPEPGPFVMVNLVRLSRALVNLLDNAHRATESLASPHIGLTLEPASGHVVFEIRDNGAGFSDLVPGKSGWRSTGLGLAFVREVAEGHGGSVAFGNLPKGSGAFVRLTLPIATKNTEIEKP